MVMYGLLGLVAAGSDWLEIQLLDDADNGTPIEEQQWDANDFRQFALGICQTVFSIALAVIFLMWVYRSNKNVRALGASGLSFTAGWSVGYYFIPIMNLFRPYQAMKEIWKASHPDFRDDWKEAPASLILPLWWGLWLVNNILGQVALRLSWRAESLPALHTAANVQFISDLLDLPLALVAWCLVYQVHGMQEEKHVRLRGDVDYSPVPEPA
jgi:hypothetical protein